MRNFSCYPAIRTLCSNCEGVGSSPGWETKVLHAAWPEKVKIAGVQPRWIQGIRSGDGVGEDQETTA